MTNLDPYKTYVPSSNSATPPKHYSEETIIGIQEEALDTSTQTLIASQQNLGQEHAETSLRPKILKDGLQLDSRAVGQRHILAPEDAGDADSNADYQTLELLGEGGMGQVHLARQIALGRNVAVKQLRPNLQRETDQQEFLSEAVATGKLEHPNIVPIYEVGKTDEGKLFYSMKNVKGKPWSELMNGLSLTENLETLLSVCDAIAFAHSQGVIHRDLKPANIMIGSFGEVLVMDWGLAMIPDNPSAASSAIAGTPAYMSPEMVMSPERANSTSDVYLLGGMLFRILSGHSPHTGKSARESLVAASRNEITVCPAERQEELDPSGELLEIALRAMKAEPADRFASVEEFHHSLRDFLMHRDSLELSARAERALHNAIASGDYAEFSRAVFGFEEAAKLWNENEDARNGTDTARLEWAQYAEQQGDFDLCLSLLEEVSSDQSTFRTRLQTAKHERESRQARLKRLRVISLAASVVIAVLATGAAIWIDSERDKALIAQQKEATERERADTAAEKAFNEARRADREATNAREAASRADAEARAAKISRLEAEQNLAIAERNAYGADMLLTQTAWERVNLPRLQVLLDRYRDREDLKGIAWNYFTRQLNPSLRSVWVGNAEAHNLAISPDGKIIATAKKHGLVVFLDSVTLETLHEFRIDPGGLYSCCFSPDGRYHAIVTGTGKVVMRDAGTGEVIREWQAHEGNALSIHFTRDSQKIVTGGSDTLVKIWQVDSEQEPEIISGHKSAVQAIDFNHDETRLVTGCEGGLVRVWDWHSRRLIRSFPSIGSDIRALEYHPSQPFIAAGGNGSDLHVWDVRTGEHKFAPIPELSRVSAIAFSPDGQNLAYGGLSDQIHLLDFESGDEIRSYRGHLYAAAAIAFDPTGRRLVSFAGDKNIMIWDTKTASDRLVLAGHTGIVREIRITPDRAFIVTAGEDGFLVVRESESGEIVARWKAHESKISGLACTTDGRIVSVGLDQKLYVWNLSGEQLQSMKTHYRSIYGLALLPDEQSVLLSDYKGVVKQIDLESLQETRSYKTSETFGFRIDVTSDGTQFVTGHKRALLRLWDLESGELVREYNGNDTVGDITVLVISDDDLYIASGGMDSTVRVWDRASGELVHTLKGHSFAIRSLDFNSDTSLLASASMDGTVKVWDLKSGQESLILKESQQAFSVAIHPDDQRILTGGNEGTIQLWDTRLWTNELRVQARARAVLKFWRERSASLEEMVASVESDDTIAADTKHLASQWAEIFWNAQFDEIVLSTQQAVSNADLTQVLRGANRLRTVGPHDFDNFKEAAHLYLEALPLLNVSERDMPRRHARECLIEAFGLATFEELKTIFNGEGYQHFRDDREIYVARQEAARRLSDEMQDDSLRLYYLATSYYELAHFHLRMREFSQATKSFKLSKETYKKRIPHKQDSFVRYSAMTHAGNYEGISHLTLCQYDQAIKVFEELIDMCDHMIEAGLDEKKVLPVRSMYVNNLSETNKRKMFIEKPMEVDKLISDNPDVLLEKGYELSKHGRYRDAIAEIDRYLNLDLEDKVEQQMTGGLNYAKCGNLMVSLSEIRQPPQDPDLLATCDGYAEECFRKSLELGWEFSDDFRNSSFLQRFLERDGVLEVVGLNLGKTLPRNRTEWRTVDDSIPEPERKHFIKQSNGDWLEVGIEANGSSFESRFVVHAETPNYLEINKVGTNIRVRLWEDKAFWGQISSQSRKVTNWNLLQTGGWLVPEE